MNLIVDQGNTSVKLALFEEEKLMQFSRVTYDDLTDELKKYTYQNCFISSVLSEIEIKKRNSLFDSPVYLNQNAKLPFKNSYKTPLTLGMDRIANIAFCSAYNPNKNSLVIDIGTCIKFDFINNGNEYLGGAIGPGLKMRFKALHQQTGKLPLVCPLDKQNELYLIGNSTQESIVSGVQNGMKNEIIATISEYRHQYKQLDIFLTGGDANYFADALKNSIFADAFLTLKGINVLTKLNA